jgi:PTS system mannose-specific IIB component
MSIELVRIDDQLIHGQVVTTWVKDFEIEQVLIINDKAAADKTQQTVLAMAAPIGIKVLVFDIPQFIDILKSTPIKRRTMLILATSIDVLALVENGLEITKINVGGMRMAEGRRSLSRAVSVTPEEEMAFRKLLERNLLIEIQMVPRDPVVLLSAIFNKS